jgi:Mitochondrial biogenesis AIM24
MFQGTVQFQVTRMRGIANAFFGGDGCYLVALTGPGRSWRQSMPLSNLAHALAPYMAKEGAACEMLPPAAWRAESSATCCACPARSAALSRPWNRDAKSCWCRPRARLLPR